MGLFRCQNILSPPEDDEFLWPVLGILQFFMVFSGDREMEVTDDTDDPGDVGGSGCHRLSHTAKQTEARGTGNVWLGQRRDPRPEAMILGSSLQECQPVASPCRGAEDEPGISIPGIVSFHVGCILGKVMCDHTLG